MEVTLKVTVQVDSCDKDSYPSDENAVRESVREGVDEALNHANNRGFNHPMADEICMSVNDVEIDEDAGELRKTLLEIGAQHPAWSVNENDNLVRIFNSITKKARETVGAVGPDDDAKADWCEEQLNLL